MFDQVGRVMCIECASDMKAVRSDDPHHVAFECINASCGHLTTFRLAQPMVQRVARAA